MSNDYWKSAEHAAEIYSDGPDYVLLHERMNNAYAEMTKNMNTGLYSNHEVEFHYVKKPSRFKIYRQRIHDAWQVLRGREHIGGDW